MDEGEEDEDEDERRGGDGVGDGAEERPSKITRDLMKFETQEMPLQRRSWLIHSRHTRS